jgi:hypothetical protein
MVVWLFGSYSVLWGWGGVGWRGMGVVRVREREVKQTSDVVVIDKQ